MWRQGAFLDVLCLRGDPRSVSKVFLNYCFFSKATFFQSNQQGMVVQPQMRPQAYTATVPQAPQYNAAPKKKSLIRIVDPKSNQDITDTIIREASMTTTGSSSPHSGQSSASGTPPAVSRFSLTVPGRILYFGQDIDFFGFGLVSVSLLKISLIAICNMLM